MTRQTRIFLYGFGPYRQFNENITAKVIQALPPLRGLAKRVFPVRFDRAQFLEALEKYRPDVVLGLGQSSRRTIELETRAANRRRTSKQTAARPIRRGGAPWLPTTLDVSYGRALKRSRNAGDYVCNYSMYVILEQIRRKGESTRFGFIHIPHDASPRPAVESIGRVLRAIGSKKRRHSASTVSACPPSPTGSAARSKSR